MHGWRLVSKGITTVQMEETDVNRSVSTEGRMLRLDDAVAVHDGRVDFGRGHAGGGDALTATGVLG